MRRLLILVLIVAALWSAYWVVGSSAQRTALQGWLDARRADGWVAEASEISVRGFPNRFDTVIRDLSLADPLTGWSWQAPEFQILALSYQPNHVIAVWPQNQHFANPAEQMTVTSELIRGSVRLQPNTALGLEEARIDLGDMEVESSRGWAAGLADGQVAIRRSAAETAPENAYDFSLTASSLRLPVPVRDVLDPAGLLPDTVEGARIRLTPVFNRPLDRFAIEETPPALMILNVGNVSFTWGAMELTVTGRLDADADGIATGSLNVIAQNWQDMLKVSVRAGWVPATMENSLASALALLAAGTGESGKLDVTITFRGGRARIGLIPIGPAPRLH